MLLANLPLTSHFYHSLLETKLQLHLFNDAGFDLMFPKGMSVETFINDILMVLFFFVVGLEIKREFTHGCLSTAKKAVLPIIATFGGVILPAVIYTLFNSGTAAAGGWGIPTATDVAFAICITSMLGKRVSTPLKVFLTTLAVTDDLIAIIVVAVFYGGELNFGLLGLSLLVIAAVVLMRRFGVKSIFPYVICALLIWGLFYYCGIHATMSGVIMAFLIPTAPVFTKEDSFRSCRDFETRLEELGKTDEEPFPNRVQRRLLRRVGKVTRGSMDMSTRLERVLSPWVDFLIMPLFALANAGVVISDPALLNIFRYDPVTGSVSMGIFFGLVLGKPLGITLFSWLSVKLRIAAMPDNCRWSSLLAVACLGGMGFTMSIFIDTLSFGEHAEELTMMLRDTGKIAILIASFAAGLLGSIAIKLDSRRSRT